MPWPGHFQGEAQPVQVAAALLGPRFFAGLLLNPERHLSSTPEPASKFLRNRQQKRPGKLLLLSWAKKRLQPSTVTALCAAHRLGALLVEPARELLHPARAEAARLCCFSRTFTLTQMPQRLPASSQLRIFGTLHPLLEFLRTQMPFQFQSFRRHTPLL